MEPVFPLFPQGHFSLSMHAGTIGGREKSKWISRLRRERAAKSGRVWTSKESYMTSIPQACRVSILWKSAK